MALEPMVLHVCHACLVPHYLLTKEYWVVLGYSNAVSVLVPHSVFFTSPYLQLAGL